MIFPKRLRSKRGVDGFMDAVSQSKFPTTNLELYRISFIEGWDAWLDENNPKERMIKQFPLKLLTYGEKTAIFHYRDNNLKRKIIKLIGSSNSVLKHWDRLSKTVNHLKSFILEADKLFAIARIDLYDRLKATRAAHWKEDWQWC